MHEWNREYWLTLIGVVAPQQFNVVELLAPRPLTWCDSEILHLINGDIISNWAQLQNALAHQGIWYQAHATALPDNGVPDPKFIGETLQGNAQKHLESQRYCLNGIQIHLYIQNPPRGWETTSIYQNWNPPVPVYHYNKVTKEVNLMMRTAYTITQHYFGSFNA